MVNAQATKMKFEKFQHYDKVKETMQLFENILAKAYEEEGVTGNPLEFLRSELGIESCDIDTDQLAHENRELKD